jgi:hypothetical protein
MANQLVYNDANQLVYNIPNQLVYSMAKPPMHNTANQPMYNTVTGNQLVFTGVWWVQMSKLGSLVKIFSGFSYAWRRLVSFLCEVERESKTLSCGFTLWFV